MSEEYSVLRSLSDGWEVRTYHDQRGVPVPSFVSPQGRRYDVPECVLTSGKRLVRYAEGYALIRRIEGCIKREEGKEAAELFDECTPAPGKEDTEWLIESESAAD